MLGAALVLGVVCAIGMAYAASALVRDWLEGES